MRKGNVSSQTTGYSARRSEEHTSELQSQSNLVCRLLLEKKKRCARVLALPRSEASPNERGCTGGLVPLTHDPHSGPPSRSRPALPRFSDLSAGLRLARSR